MLTLEEKPVVSTARKNLPICVLDDEADLVELTTDRLTKLGFPVVGTTNPQDALQKIRLGGCRAVIADFKMPAMDGLAFLEKVLQYDPGIYVILVTGYYSVDAAIDAIKRGAYDYLSKPLDFNRLTKTLDDLAELFTQRSQIRDLEDRLLQNLQFHGIVGRSPAMFEVFDLA
ncbi:MAG TPA: response regulator, partial [Candidatus Dormibacteraeota bacterium]|nr:response regulator [Candidatus Dormibacteraeota bacterium]